MEFNLAEDQQLKAVLVQAEVELQELEQLHMALVGGGCGEVIVG